jgi:uncharacterized membrane protein (DUF4010 family)
MRSFGVMSILGSFFTSFTIIDQSHINKFGIAIAVVLPVPGGAATMTP